MELMDILPDTHKFWSVSSDKKVTYQQRKSPEYVNFIATNQNSPNTQNILALLYQDPCNSDANWDNQGKHFGSTEISKIAFDIRK